MFFLNNRLRTRERNDLLDQAARVNFLSASNIENSTAQVFSIFIRANICFHDIPHMHNIPAYAF